MNHDIICVQRLDLRIMTVRPKRPEFPTRTVKTNIAALARSAGD